MRNTMLGFGLLAGLALGATACGDDHGVVHQDAGFSVLDSGNAGRLDAGVADRGSSPTDSGQRPVDSGGSLADAGSLGDAETPLPADGGAQVADAQAAPDVGDEPGDAGPPARDGGPRPIDGGAPPGPDARPGAMLVGRQLLCDSEVINRVQLNWNNGRLIGLTATTLGEADITWRLMWANDRPLSAEGRDGDGGRHMVRWTYTRDKLTSATLIGGGTQIDWRFRYNERAQLTAASFVHTADGVQQRQEGSFTYGRNGEVVSYMDAPIRYLNNRPATVGGERLMYRGEQLAGIPGGRITYTAGRIGRLDDGSGCIYTYRYMPQGEADYFIDSMPFAGIGALFSATGRYHGTLDPGRWLYMTLALLLNE